MKCRDARELINSYIDNGLDPKNDTCIMEHVKKCPACAREMDILLAYRDVVKGIKPVKAPHNFMAELQRRIEAERGGRFRIFLADAARAWRHFTFPYEAAGVIAVALLIFFLYTPLFRVDRPAEAPGGNRTAATEGDGKSAVTAEGETRREKISAGEKSSMQSIRGERLSSKVSVSPEINLKTADEDRSPLEEKKETVYEAGKSSDKEYSAGSRVREMKFRSTAKAEKTAGRVNKSEEEVSLSAGDIIAESGASVKKREVKDDGRVLYTVEVKESSLKTLTEKLEKNFTVSSRIISIKESNATVEFTITKKPD